MDTISRPKTDLSPASWEIDYLFRRAATILIIWYTTTAMMELQRLFRFICK